jgi:hypothetical protein
MPSAVKPPQTLYDKVFEDHIVEEKEEGTILLYIGQSISFFNLTSCLLLYRQASCPRSDITSKQIPTLLFVLMSAYTTTASF